ncbi:MAG TPA: LysR family transcriptional regulator [Pararobbsia sp.]|nr:LysR family transcriptional regulator [Pararobbsia sp.]
MEMNDLAAFVSVARAGGFRDAARTGGVSASSLSIAVRRLETRLGLRLLNRSTRSVAPTEAGQRLLDKIAPLFGEMEAALDVLNGFREKPTGTLRLNVPSSASRIVLAPVMARFLDAYPDIRVEIVAEDGFVDVLAAGCDAGIRYEERLAQDMIAVPVGPRVQRFATAAAPAYLDTHGRPDHPSELLAHQCLRGQFQGGAIPTWDFERHGEILRVDPPSRLMVRPGAAIDLAVTTAIAGGGIVHLFEDMLRPYLEAGWLEPILEPWWQNFSGPFLYYPGHRHVPAPLRAFIDFMKVDSTWADSRHPSFRTQNARAR